MKSILEIKNKIINSFKEKTQHIINEQSIIGMYTESISESIGDAYQEIENNKNPHIYTKLRGNDIDDLGILVRCPREENESDTTYLHRAIKWTTNNEATNIDAISCALLNLKYSSAANYVPLTNGVGTGTVYVIPKKLDNETKELAINEIKYKIYKKASTTSLIDIIIPELLKIKIICNITLKNSDNKNIINKIEEDIKTYINSIAPGDYLYIKDIEKIANNNSEIDFFRVYKLYINDIAVDKIKIMQEIKSKFIFDEFLYQIQN